MTGIRTLGVSLLLLLLTSPEALAQEPSDPVDKMIAAGRYGEAEAALRRWLSRHPGDPGASARMGRLLLTVGRYGEAEEVLRPAREDPACRTLLAESLLLRGRIGRAEKEAAAVLKVSPDRIPVRFLLARIDEVRGRRSAAATAYEWFFERYATHDLEDPEDLTLVARASVRLARLRPDVEMDFQVTQKLLGAVIKKHPDYLPAYIARADLFLDVYEDQFAKKWYERALRRNPRYPPALYGEARQLAFRFNDLGAVRKCREALLANPNLFEAKEFIARIRMGDGQYAEAEKLLKEILAVNPRRKAARGLLAAIDYLKGSREGYEERMAGLLADDPRFGRAYRDLARVLEDQRRFLEATQWARKACDVAPRDFRSFEILGRNLVHLAREAEAKEALEKSRDLDPFAHYLGNPLRENMIEVLTHLEDFAETRTKHFIYRIQVGENAILSRYYHRFLEHSWDLLTKEYGFEPEGPILTEIFHLHEDFAARTVGLPGIGALGACFGKVITLDSPSARPPGAFCWATTAYHELTHVMTLQLSKYRVPRWFTEGLSVFAEREYAGWWARDMDRRLFDALRNGEIPPVSSFNREFRGPNVLFAYYLAGRMCEFLRDEFGFPKILEMLHAYARDKQTPAVLSDVLGIDPAEYDRRFAGWAEKQVGGYRLVPRWSEKTVKRMIERARKNPKDLDALATLSWAWFQRGDAIDARTSLGKALALAPDDPRLALLRGEIAYRDGRPDKAEEWYRRFLATGSDDMFARLHLASILEKQGKHEEASAQLEAARACFPAYIGPGNPWLELARLKKGAGDLEGAMREVEGFVRLANTDIPHRLELAAWYESRGDWKGLARILTQVVQIYPLDGKEALPVHVRLARALGRLADYDRAAMEYEVALELGLPSGEEPGVRVELGEIYYLQGRRQDARRQARAALEKAPDLDSAKALLEKTEQP